MHAHHALIGLLVTLCACGGASAAPPAESAPSTAGSLHASPTRDEVMSALSEVQPAIHACGDDGHTEVPVQMHFVSNGSVSSVTVPPGTTNAACIIEAASRTRLPPFANPQFTVTFPFRL